MIPGSLAMMASGGETYRFLRLHITANVGGSVYGVAVEIDYSADGGTTWLPASAMTANNAPSPLVASADSEFSASYEAWLGFDNSSATNPWNSANSAMPHWIKIDLGAGNEISPNRFRYVNWNSGGNDYTLKDFTIQGSNTGAFTGEQATLLTKTGEPTQAHLTTITYTI